ASTGSRLWVKRYNGPGNGFDSASSLGVRPDGSKVFVTGASEGTLTYGDSATVAYKASIGTRVWVRRYHGPENGDGATALAVSPDGSKVFVTGASLVSACCHDYATVVYNASTGTRLWVK